MAEMVVMRNPILNVRSSLNLIQVKLNAVTVGYNPVDASLPCTKKYSKAV